MKRETGLIDAHNPVIEPLRFSGTAIPCVRPQRICGQMTVKSVARPRRFIPTFSAANSLVLDPFAGTGWTDIAALLEKRGFVGFDTGLELAEGANRRVAGASRQ